MNYRKQFKELRTLKKVEDCSKYSVLDLKEGSFFVLESKMYKVISVSTYTEKSGFQWKELECYCINEDTTVYIEIEKDDYIEVYMTIKELSMKDLNKNADQIEEMSEQERGVIVYDNVNFSYEDDYGATWRKENEIYKVYFYDFESSELKAKGITLTVEEWDLGHNEYEYKAYLSKEIYQDSIKIEVI